MASIEAELADLDLQDSPNYTQTAKKLYVDRSTLSRRHRGKTASVMEGRQITLFLTNQQKKPLIDYISTLNERGIPPTNAMIRVFAQNICGKLPGKNWSNCFVRAHKDKLQSKFLQGADLDWKKADNAYQYQLYFDPVRVSITSRFYANIR